MTAAPSHPPARFIHAGSPTVVFIAGLGNPGDTWDAVLERVSAHASTLTYDRAGVAANPAVNGARTCDDLVDELAGLLAVLDPPAPGCWSGTPSGAW